MMTGHGMSLLDAIRIAKEAEQRTEEYYGKAARRIVNPFGHRLLMQLSRFERFHYETLTALEQSLRDQGAFIEYRGAGPTPPAPSEVGGAPEATPPSAMGILTRALEIAQKAEERHTSLAERTEDPAGREMFTRLAAEERQHFRIVRNAYQSLNSHGVWDWQPEAEQA